MAPGDTTTLTAPSARFDNYENKTRTLILNRSAKYYTIHLHELINLPTIQQCGYDEPTFDNSEIFTKD